MEAVGSWEREAAPLAYEIACAIEVPGTVGSLAVGYGPLFGEDAVGGEVPGVPELEPPLPPPLTMAAAAASPSPPPTSRSAPSLPASSSAADEKNRRRQRRRQQQGSDGWAKLFVPNYDGNKIYVFSMEPGPEL